MNRRRLLVGLSVGVASLSGCISARRSIRLTFDSIPPEPPEDCTTSSMSVQFPEAYDKEPIETFVRRYEQELQETLVDGELSLSFEVTSTSWRTNYIVDLRVRGDVEHNAAYYVGERLVIRTEAAADSMPPDPREGEIRECREHRPSNRTTVS